MLLISRPVLFMIRTRIKDWHFILHKDAGNAGKGRMEK